jgi:hypothetical protein
VYDRELGTHHSLQGNASAQKDVSILPPAQHVHLALGLFSQWILLGAVAILPTTNDCDNTVVCHTASPPSEG